MCDVFALFYLASFASMSLAMILAAQEVSIQCQTRGSRKISRNSSRTPLLGRRPVVDEEQGSEAPSHSQGAGNDSVLSLYGTFSDFSQNAFPIASDQVSGPNHKSRNTSKPKPLLSWRNKALPSMPESFAAEYELIRTFPHISMAPVHLVKHRDSGEQLIIKQLKNELIIGDQCWPTEAYILTKVLGNHKNVLGIKDVHIAHDGTHMPYANMVMGFASSGDLYDIIGKCMKHGKKVPSQFVLHFVSSMIDALAFIHHGHASYDSRRGVPVVVDQPVILHCDIKPDNIFLNIDEDSVYGLPDIMLADFGLAGFEDVKGIRGTRVYFPPELLEADSRASEELDYWKEAQRTSFCSMQSDMYSFSATLFELLAFRRYRPGDDIEAAFYASNVSGYIDILFLLQSGLSEWAEERSLAKSWHYVSFAFKQRLRLWHDAGGRMPSWLLENEEIADGTAIARKPSDAACGASDSSLDSVSQFGRASSVYSRGIDEALTRECDDLTEMLRLLDDM